MSTFHADEVQALAAVAVNAAAAAAASAATVSAATGLTLHEQVGFELGWDHAHHRLTPPAPHDQMPSALLNGLRAGQAVFGDRTLRAPRPVRKWLQLRLHAWLRGRSVELMQVTPHYLAQIDVAHCPITRAPLTHGTMQPTDASIDRVRNDAGYAAGNLAVISALANRAKGRRGFAESMTEVRVLTDRPVLDVDGLGAAAWSRIAILCSFVEAMPHADAAALPLRVLPPPRLHLLNPVQALQALISQQLTRPGWAERSKRFEALLPGKPTKRAYQQFFHALLPRVLESAPPAVRRAETPAHRQCLRWAVEDAWRNPLVLRRWTDFARLLDAATCQHLVERASALKLCTQRALVHGDQQATEGWQLDTRGYLPDGVVRPGRPQDLVRLSGGGAPIKPDTTRTPDAQLDLVLG